MTLERVELTGTFRYSNSEYGKKEEKSEKLKQEMDQDIKIFLYNLTFKYFRLDVYLENRVPTSISSGVEYIVFNNCLFAKPYRPRCREGNRSAASVLLLTTAY